MLDLPIKTESENIQDYIGVFAVTAGIGIEEHLERFEMNDDDYSAIMLKTLADRLAEAFAELLHKRTRTEFWAYSKDENTSQEDLLKEKYEGIRPAPGYPACPEHSEKRKIFDLLEVEEKLGINLTESFAMYPAASVSGYYFANPEAKYFAVGKIDEDQISDYAERINIDKDEVEKLLRNNLIQ